MTLKMIKVSEKVIVVLDSEFQIIKTRLKNIFISQIGTIIINIFLPTRNMFVYSCSIKILALGFSELLESIFCILLVMEAFSLQKVLKMLEEVVVSWQEVR